ncbi:hypothetical protein GCM10027348_39430 [Hymenobacter tenuis]
MRRQKRLKDFDFDLPDAIVDVNARVVVVEENNGVQSGSWSISADDLLLSCEWDLGFVQLD